MITHCFVDIRTAVDQCRYGGCVVYLVFAHQQQRCRTFAALEVDIEAEFFDELSKQDWFGSTLLRLLGLRVTYAECRA